MTRRLGRVYCDDINGGGCGGILGMKVSMVILTSLGVERVMQNYYQGLRRNIVS